jgi:prepilin-type N-terminal cleavage/methylation domain-containing protein
MPIYSFFSFPFRSFSNFFKSCQRQFIASTIPKKHRDRHAKTLGFTLIEVLVVMIIVGILSAIIAPSWLAFTNNQRLAASQTKIFQAIKTAQSDAKIRQTESSNRTRITLTTNTTTGAFRLDNVRANSGQAQSLEQGVVISSLTSGVSPTVLTSPYAIEFDSKGFLYDPNRTANLPICINLSTSLGQKKKWIKIQTLLGAITTGADTTCSG